MVQIITGAAVPIAGTDVSRDLVRRPGNVWGGLAESIVYSSGMRGKRGLLASPTGDVGDVKGLVGACSGGYWGLPENALLKIRRSQVRALVGAHIGRVIHHLFDGND